MCSKKKPDCWNVENGAPDAMCIERKVIVADLENVDYKVLYAKYPEYSRGNIESWCVSKQDGEKMLYDSGKLDSVTGVTLEFKLHMWTPNLRNATLDRYPRRTVSGA